MKTFNTPHSTIQLDPLKAINPTVCNTPHMIETFSSMGKFANAVKVRKHHEGFSKQANSTFNRGSFVGGETMQSTLHDIVLGKAELGKKATALSNKVNSLIFETPKRKRVKAVQGGRASVGAYLAGSPMPMRRRKVLLSSSAPLDVVVNLSSSGAISASDLEKRGVAIAAMVKRIAVDRPVNLHLALTLLVDVTNTSYIGLIKFPTSPVDTNRLAYCLASQGLARGIGFALAADGLRLYAEVQGKAAPNAAYGGSVRWPFHNFAYIGHTGSTGGTNLGSDLQTHFKTDMLYIAGAFSDCPDYIAIQRDALKWVNDTATKFIKRKS